MIEYACFIEKMTRLYTIVNSYMKQTSSSIYVTNINFLYYGIVHE